MKKIWWALILAIICVVCLTGCIEDSTEKNKLLDKYNIGDEVELGGVMFNIYKKDTDKNELYLLAQSAIATTSFSDEENKGSYYHTYQGSLAEKYVNQFVRDLAGKGVVVKKSGLIDYEDLYKLGFTTSDTMTGRPYLYDGGFDFVTYVDEYWVGGYCKYDTMSWAYDDEILDPKSYDKEYGIRPMIVIDPAEIGKKVETPDPNLSIKEIVNSHYKWVAEGGIHNPYDRYIFDCENMMFINEFESPQISRTSTYSMKFLDDTMIEVSGVRFGNEDPAKITIVNENKLKIRFVNYRYNSEDYFLVRTDEVYSDTTSQQ